MSGFRPKLKGAILLKPTQRYVSPADFFVASTIFLMRRCKSSYWSFKSHFALVYLKAIGENKNNFMSKG